MYLNITDSAQERLEKINEKHGGRWMLYYNENFKGTYACGLRGTFTLKLVPEDSAEQNKTIDSTIGPVLVERTDYTELADAKELTLDYKKSSNTLSLRSPFDWIAPNMDVLDENDKKLY